MLGVVTLAGCVPPPATSLTLGCHQTLHAAGSPPTADMEWSTGTVNTLFVLEGVAKHLVDADALRAEAAEQQAAAASRPAPRTLALRAASRTTAAALLRVDVQPTAYDRLLLRLP